MPKVKKSQHVRVPLTIAAVMGGSHFSSPHETVTDLLRGVAGEVLWYPKSDFEIVTRVTPDL